jgi:hypothetical protein
MAKKVMGVAPESEHYVEIGGFVHQDEGEANVKLYVGDVDKPLQVDPAAITKQIAKLRVGLTITEDKSVSQNCVYQKNVVMSQEVLSNMAKSGNSSSGVSVKQQGVQADDPNAPANDIPAWGKVLKNFTDQIHESFHGDIRMLWIGLVAVGVCAGVALAFAILR